MSVVRTQLGVHLVGDALGHGHGGDSPGLGAADHAEAAEALLVQVLRQLRCLAATGLSCNRLINPSQTFPLYVPRFIEHFILLSEPLTFFRNHHFTS